MKFIQIADACICCGSDHLASSPAVLMPFVAHRAFGQAPVGITQDWGLRDLSLGFAYTLCQTLQCQICGVLFLNYRFTSEQMTALYDDYRGDTYNQQRLTYEPNYASTANDYIHRHSYINDIEAWLTANTSDPFIIFDWGDGNGQNTPFLGKRPAYVYDISGVPVLDGIQRLSTPPASFPNNSLIVCSQVLEHTPSPRDLLNQIRTAMSPDSLLYLEVPSETLIHENPGDLNLSSRKRHWHEHINFFTPKSLHCLLADIGLKIIASHAMAINNGARQAHILGILSKPI